MKKRAFLGLIAPVVLGLFAGCEEMKLRYKPYENEAFPLTAEQHKQMDYALAQVFGNPRRPRAPEAMATMLKSTDRNWLVSGAANYRRMCMHCHGLSGDGNGPTAGPKDGTWLYPRPRDYRPGTFKFTSTGPQAKPTRDDLMRTLKYGVSGTSMPAFLVHYDEDPDQIEQILDYVLLLSVRGQAEQFLTATVSGFDEDKITGEMVLEEAGTVIGLWNAAENQIVVPQAPPPEPTFASLERGRNLFYDTKQTQCSGCHGNKALGDGLSGENQDPEKTKDDWGNQAVPANLKLGFYRGGRRPLDLFRRIHSGVKGTPMAAQGGSLSAEDIWHLVNFVRQIPYEDIETIGVE